MKPTHASGRASPEWQCIARRMPNEGVPAVIASTGAGHKNTCQSSAAYGFQRSRWHRRPREWPVGVEAILAALIAINGGRSPWLAPTNINQLWRHGRYAALARNHLLAQNRLHHGDKLRRFVDDNLATIYGDVHVVSILRCHRFRRDMIYQLDDTRISCDVRMLKLMIECRHLMNRRNRRRQVSSPCPLKASINKSRLNPRQ